MIESPSTSSLGVHSMRPDDPQNSPPFGAVNLGIVGGVETIETFTVAVILVASPDELNHAKNPYVL